MKTLEDIKVLRGVKVLVRADFNVPIANGAIADAFRIRATLPTIQYLQSKGARIILVSHLESVNGENNSLEPIAKHLNKELNIHVHFVKDWKRAHQMSEQLHDGDCILLENLREFEGEKKNDPKFAQELASLADIYVNDAFSVSHREHASIVGVPKLLPSYAGLQLEREITNLSRAFNPSHPFLFILGGAKFETKLPLLEKFMNIADTVFVGGALANDLFKEKGYEVGTSLVSKVSVDLKSFAENPKLVLPVDVLNQNQEMKMADQLSATDRVVDSGNKTVGVLREKIARSKFILWNGPLGIYEDGYRGPTLDLAKLVADATLKDTVTLVGGGDTLAAISTLGIEDKFTFISTGGGAMLDFLAKGTLPGIEALQGE